MGNSLKTFPVLVPEADVEILLTTWVQTHYFTSRLQLAFKTYHTLRVSLPLVFTHSKLWSIFNPPWPYSRSVKFKKQVLRVANLKPTNALTISHYYKFVKTWFSPKVHLNNKNNKTLDIGMWLGSLTKSRKISAEDLAQKWI